MLKIGFDSYVQQLASSRTGSCQPCLGSCNQQVSEAAEKLTHASGSCTAWHQHNPLVNFADALKATLATQGSSLGLIAYLAERPAPPEGEPQKGLWLAQTLHAQHQAVSGHHVGHRHKTNFHNFLLIRCSSQCYPLGTDH